MPESRALAGFGVRLSAGLGADCTTSKRCCLALGLQVL